ncbi:MAG: prolyl oligopeptidase family serine peptidase [bacterium]|nr:prolyl oligopeptidase family serine peptidase [bacterium]
MTLLLVCAAALPVWAANDAPRLIPRETLFGNPEKASPAISPDGKRIAYLAPVDGVLNVWVQTIGEDDAKVVTQDKKRGIRIFFWAEDNQRVLYLQDSDGDENWHVYAVDLSNNVTRDMTPFLGVKAGVTAIDRDFPNELLVEMNLRNPSLFDVYRLNLSNGALELDTENPGDVAGWVVDGKFQVRGAQAMTPDGGSELRVRKTVNDEWTPFIKWTAEDNLSGAAGFTPDGNGLYLQDSRDYNALRLIEIDLDSKKTKVLAQDPQYDVSSLIVNPDTEAIQAVSFEKDREEWTVLDKSIAKDVKAIQKIHRGDFMLLSRDHADQNWVVAFTTDDGPVPYYVYHRETGEADFLFTSRPKLEEYTLARMEPISFKARDGLTIHGYLTLPPNAKAKGLPMVLDVHGGPWARDSWGYNPEAQWLANRGYACLQVNFRGSTGYGKDFINAGNKEWGRKMQDDLTDAVNWAVKKGYADPEKVAIYGGSYGGYAALAGAAFTPDVYACAISMVGPSNLITLLESIPPYWEPVRKMFDERVGSLETERELLEERSPLTRADQIHIPMLIAQGANDPRVKQAESEQIVNALRDKGKKVEYLLFEDEGHGFARPENRLKFYAAAEKFLAEILGGRYEE